jgi:MraZ protein
VSTQFVGQHQRSLDPKGRLILPSRFRQSFELQAYVSKWRERCLAIWTPAAFDSRAATMSALLDAEPVDRALARSFFSGTAEVDLDRQGRVFLPQYLREYAGLAENAPVLVQGASDHIELWNPQTWAVHEALGDASLGGEPVAAGERK